MVTRLDIPVQVESHGPVPETMPALAVAKVRSLLRLTGRPVLFARVTLAMASDPAVARPAVACVSVDLGGPIARAQAVGETMREAIERMAARLRVRLEKLARNWEARRGSRPTGIPGEWRHQSIPAPRAPYFQRPAGSRRVIQRGSYAAVRQSPQDAIAELDLLDYDFQIYADKVTGQDTMVYRTVDGYRLAQLQPRSYLEYALPAAVSVDEHAAPRLTVEEAIAHLEATGQEFLFFADAVTGRGSALYHRYDGHYGLVVAPRPLPARAVN